MKMRLEDVPLEKLVVSPINPRKTYIDEHLDRLKMSLKLHGQRDLAYVYLTNGQYEIVKGQRRWLALKQLKEEGSPIFVLKCIVIEDGTEVDAKIDAITEEVYESLSVRDKTIAILSITALKLLSLEQAYVIFNTDKAQMEWNMVNLGQNEVETLAELEKEYRPTKEEPVVPETKEGIIETYPGLTSEAVQYAKWREARGVSHDDAVKEVKELWDMSVPMALRLRIVSRDKLLRMAIKKNLKLIEIVEQILDDVEEK